MMCRYHDGLTWRHVVEVVQFHEHAHVVEVRDTDGVPVFGHPREFEVVSS